MVDAAASYGDIPEDLIFVPWGGGMENGKLNY